VQKKASCVLIEMQMFKKCMQKAKAIARIVSQGMDDFFYTITVFWKEWTNYFMNGKECLFPHKAAQ